VLKPRVISSRAERLWENVTQSNVGPRNVVLRPSRNAFPWIVHSARNMIGFKQIEFFDHTGKPNG